MQVKFVILLFSKTVAEKLVEDQVIDSLRNPSSLPDDNIDVVCDAIRRPGGLVSDRMLERWSQIFIQVAKKLKLTAIMLKTIEH